MGFSRIWGIRADNFRFRILLFGLLSLMLMSFTSTSFYSAEDGIDWYHKGLYFFNYGRYEEAIEAMDRAIGNGLSKKAEGRAWYFKGRSLIFLNKKEEALKAIDKAISIGFDDEFEALAWYSKGQILSSLGQYEEAIRAFDKAISFGLSRANEAEARFLQGNIFYAKKDYDNAIVAYKKSVELNAKEGKAWEKLALIYKEKGDYKRALESIKKAVELSPENWLYRYYQGEISLLSDDLTTATEAFNYALELSSKELEKEKSGLKYSNAALIALLAKRVSDAEKYGKAALEFGDKSRYIHGTLGHIYIIQGKKSAAMTEYSKYFEENGGKKGGVIKRLKNDFFLLKKCYPEKISLIEGVEKELEIK